MQIHEARLDVQQILNSHDAVAATKAYVQDRMENPVSSEDTPAQVRLDTWKIAEYALLVPAIEQSVKTFVQQPAAACEARDVYGVSAIAQRVGIFVAHHAKVALEQNPEARMLAAAYADIRGLRAHDRDYANAIAPLEIPLRVGAQASAESTLMAVRANAATIKREFAASLTQDEHIALTRRSHKLALAQPLVHLSDLAPTGSLLDSPAAEQLLQLGKSNTVDLAIGMQHWPAHSGATLAEAAEDHEDVRIGCPFSFTAKDLRVGYYETMVDLIVYNDSWPELSE